MSPDGRGPARSSGVNARVAPGADGKVTLREVASLAGVHPATASRALNQKTRGLVREETARRVEDAARQLDYRPDHLARSLKTRRSSTVGVLLPDLTNPLFPPIVRGIEDRLAPKGYVALIGNTDNDAERERLVLEGMRDRYIDGLIAATAQRRHPQLVAIARSGLPVVLVNRVVDDHLLPSVSVDDEAGMRHAVAHLVSLGHRDIAHVAGPQRFSTGFRRFQGFVAGLRALGLSPDDRRMAFAESFSQAEGYRGTRELLGRGVGFTAIVAGNDMIALGCLRAFDEAGLSCPGDISLVGFNDTPFMDRIAPPLTTVRLPHYEVGVEAAQLLLDRIANPTAPVKLLFLPPELVVRASTGPPRSSPGAR
ncbi:MAG TPA: LacI family DNA-binding transcriptional regulator [Acidimicrobiales bacterium]|nr:LacI family DNA-binding transcriptional regulator [Acidimicrobiales bacterium]